MIYINSASDNDIKYLYDVLLANGYKKSILTDKQYTETSESVEITIDKVMHFNEYICRDRYTTSVSEFLYNNKDLFKTVKAEHLEKDKYYIQTSKFNIYLIKMSSHKDMYSNQFIYFPIKDNVSLLDELEQGKTYTANNDIIRFVETLLRAEGYNKNYGDNKDANCFAVYPVNKTYALFSHLNIDFDGSDIIKKLLTKHKSIFDDFDSDVAIGDEIFIVNTSNTGKSNILGKTFKVLNISETTKGSCQIDAGGNFNTFLNANNYVIINKVINTETKETMERDLLHNNAMFNLGDIPPSYLIKMFENKGFTHTIPNINPNCVRINFNTKELNFHKHNVSVENYLSTAQLIELLEIEDILKGIKNNDAVKRGDFIIILNEGGHKHAKYSIKRVFELYTDDAWVRVDTNEDGNVIRSDQYFIIKHNDSVQDDSVQDDTKPDEVLADESDDIDISAYNRKHKQNYNVGEKIVVISERVDCTIGKEYEICEKGDVTNNISIRDDVNQLNYLMPTQYIHQSHKYYRDYLKSSVDLLIDYNKKAEFNEGDDVVTISVEESDEEFGYEKNKIYKIKEVDKINTTLRVTLVNEDGDERWFSVRQFMHSRYPEYNKYISEHNIKSFDTPDETVEDTINNIVKEVVDDKFKTLNFNRIEKYNKEHFTSFKTGDKVIIISSDSPRKDNIYTIERVDIDDSFTPIYVKIDSSSSLWLNTRQFVHESHHLFKYLTNETNKSDITIDTVKVDNIDDTLHTRNTEQTKSSSTNKGTSTNEIPTIDSVIIPKI